MEISQPLRATRTCNVLVEQYGIVCRSGKSRMQRTGRLRIVNAKFRVIPERGDVVLE